MTGRSQVQAGRRWLACATTLLLALACSDREPGPGAAGRPGESVSPSARPDLVAFLRQDLAAPRHPSDGGGRAWLEGAASATAGEAGRWTVVYEAGPLGIAAGGMLFLQVSPFWGWSTPQVLYPEGLGFTEITTDAEGIELGAETLDQGLLGIRVGGRGLQPGERVRIDYGAGPAGALADRYAEHRSRFWIGVDGDGDGVRALVPDPPAVDVAAGPPALLVVTLPSTLRPGERSRLTVAVLDRLGNAGVAVGGEIAFTPAGDPAGGLGFPATVALRPEDGGRRTVAIEARAEGIYRLQAEGPGGLAARSNPLVVAGDGPRVLWGDLHGHSGLSDGTGTPADYLGYARDVAALDVAALTDHDHWGLEPLAQHGELWQEIERETARFHEPGRFVTLLGYEWTSWLHGHRHVLYFGDEGEVLSSLDPAYESPLQLWEALRGRPALTFAHHSAGGPVATNWEIPPDPELEPVTEVASVHGASEAADAPHPIYSPVAGNFVRDVLDRGYRLGFVGSGDSHDGHPGLAGIASASGGLAAILSQELTRDGVLAALRARRVYATNGPRMLLRAALGGRPMGATVEAPAAREELAAMVVGTAPLARLELIRGGRVVETIPGGGREVLELRREVPALAAGEYLYLRAVQEDGGTAWSSPFFGR